MEGVLPSIPAYAPGRNRNKVCSAWVRMSIICPAALLCNPRANLINLLHFHLVSHRPQFIVHSSSMPS